MVTTTLRNMLVQMFSLMFVFCGVSRAEDTFVVAEVPLITCIKNNPGVNSCSRIHGNNPPAALACSDFPCTWGFCLLPFSATPVAAQWNIDKPLIREVPDDGVTQGTLAVTTKQACFQNIVCADCQMTVNGEFCGVAFPFQSFDTGFLYAELLDQPCVKAPQPAPGGGGGTGPVI